jgi:hypothetical protein
MRQQGSGESYIKRSLMICTFHTIFFGYHMEKNGIGGAYSMYGERRGISRFVVGTPEGKENFWNTQS